MKKLFLMVAFAGFAMAASAQTQPTASTGQSTEKKECTMAEKAACEKTTASCTVKSDSKSAGCCAAKKSSTAMASKEVAVDKKQKATQK